MGVPAHAVSTSMAFRRKRLEEDLCWIVPRVPSEDMIGGGSERLVSLLVGALGPVNYEGLHQG